MTPKTPDPVSPGSDVRSGEIEQAAAILRAGGLVAFPTETVYGLGADAENEAAVRAVFAAKGRPADHPVIVHLADIQDIVPWSGHIPNLAWRLAEAFWPGPLTLILPRAARAKDVVTGGLDTVGLRVPSHPVAQALLREFGGAIAAPSANRFGRVSPTRAEHVRAEFADSLPLILDGGDCEVGLESTIVDFSTSSPAILRPGAITKEQVESVCGQALQSLESNLTRCSGRLESHYAPRALVEMVEPQAMVGRAAELLKQGKKVAILGPPDSIFPAGTELILLGNDAASRARALYSALRKVDELGCDVVLVSPPAPHGLGAALLDRLQKAAGRRGQAL
jgi:L-threonylcarbamoyladenylate synthase